MGLVVPVLGPVAAAWRAPPAALGGFAPPRCGPVMRSRQPSRLSHMRVSMVWTSSRYALSSATLRKPGSASAEIPCSAISELRRIAESGGLISYGPNLFDATRRQAFGRSGSDVCRPGFERLLCSRRPVRAASVPYSRSPSHTRSCRVGRERISATTSGTAVRAPSIAAAIEFGKHRLNFKAVAISSGSEGRASAGFISAIAWATVSVLVARTDAEKSSHRADARPGRMSARANDADASPPAKGHTRTRPSLSATIGSEKPSTKDSRSRTFASLAPARRESAQPGIAPATIRSAAWEVRADKVRPLPSHRDLPPPSAGTTETRRRGQSTSTTSQLLPRATAPAERCLGFVRGSWGVRSRAPPRHD
jgi:hypothetical protein